MKCEKFGSHIFSCQSLLLGTNIPNDTIASYTVVINSRHVMNSKSHDNIVNDESYVGEKFCGLLFYRNIEKTCFDKNEKQLFPYILALKITLIK